MESISRPLPVEIATEGKPNDEEVEAVPAKKRGGFLPSRFFGNKDKEPVLQPDEKPGVVEDPLKPTADVHESLAAQDLPVDRLALRTSPAAASTPSVISTNEPSPTMIPTDSAHQTDNSRATAQLTFGFEITSLQLTPSFKLGAIQLRALSNVVSLHLVAVGQKENLLAAAVAFQIEEVELAGTTGFKSLLLKPLGESREAAAPQPKLQIAHVALSDGGDAPISVTASELASTTVQLFGTFAITAIEFTPAFEIDSLRLEPASKIVFVRVAPSPRTIAQDLPPTFEIAEIHNDEDSQIVRARLIPSGPENV